MMMAAEKDLGPMVVSDKKPPSVMEKGINRYLRS